MLCLWGLKNVEMSIKNLAAVHPKKNDFDRTAFLSTINTTGRLAYCSSGKRTHD